VRPLALLAENRSAQNMSPRALRKPVRSATCPAPPHVSGIEGKTLDEIFGYPDNLKFCSSMTLFARAAQDSALFKAALRKHCGDEPDPLTLARLVDG
jgi:uncharacterized protein (DUF1810 family)